MDIHVVTHSLSRNGGGIPAVLWGLYSCFPRDVKVNITGYQDQYASSDVLIDQAYTVDQYPYCQWSPHHFSRSLKKELFENRRFHVKSIVHLHGLWLYPSILCCEVVKKKAIPYIISPHGMLEKWALRHSLVKKKIAWRMYEKKNLQYAHCIHVGSSAEYAAVRSIGLKNPVAIIPNGVSIPQKEIYPNHFSDDWSGCNVLLFLARYHKKKGVEELIEGWKRTSYKKSNWRLALVGYGEKKYENHLKKLIKKYDLARYVKMYVPLFGYSRYEYFINAHGYILPSHSEGMPMTVLDAMACGVPVLMTKQCNIHEAFQNGGAYEISCDPQKLSQQLDAFFQRSPEDLRSVALRGKHFMTTQYGWQQKAHDMLSVYQWLVGDADRPDCVKLD